MGVSVTPEDSAPVPCEFCLREIPHPEAGTVEAEDYVMHFCGLACFRLWREAKDVEAPVED